MNGAANPQFASIAAVNCAIAQFVSRCVREAPVRVEHARAQLLRPLPQLLELGRQRLGQVDVLRLVLLDVEEAAPRTVESACSTQGLLRYV